ncbi:MAG TPA: tetratricopeptide repeat protein [Candidatus Acidoferrum sp.]|nr:tetratricopeptide repeat protein [Candidatus Acidoferrum sp.]
MGRLALGGLLKKPSEGIRRWCSLAVRYGLAIGLLLLAYAATKRGVAAWYFQRESPQALEAAIRWDPGNAQYYDALATMQHFYADSDNPDEQVTLYERAVSLSPQNALYWADLGTALDWEGNRNQAQRAFEHSKKLFPNSPDINWKLANFYVRDGKTEEALHTLREVLQSGGVPQQNVFALAKRSTEDKEVILEEMVPDRAPILLGYLNYQAFLEWRPARGSKATRADVASEILTPWDGEQPSSALASH